MKELLKLCQFEMPGDYFRGELPSLTSKQRQLRKYLEAHVHMLAAEIGDRNYKKPEQLQEAADYIFDYFDKVGLSPCRHRFMHGGMSFENIEVEIEGDSNPEDIIVVGAHYDSADCPGANDNGSGVAALLEIGRLLQEVPPGRTIRLVAFTNEEHFYGSMGMGSYFYAERCSDRQENIIGMIALETMGCYSSEPESQKFPEGLGAVYPDTGDFIGFVGNLDSGAFLRDVIKAFRSAVDFPSEGLIAPTLLESIGRSDHSQFWNFGYPGIMVTDTADYRYEHYHPVNDTVDKVDFDCLARVVTGMADALVAL
ncbi:MAG TPA: M28 family peptidase [Candidatus Melainabacteria bacterium]|nr:M28 family peptidase [Candidatus Melainabacteria bacterium]